MVLGRIAIEDIYPRTPTGAYPAKAIVGEKVRVSASIFRDGHAILSARLLWRRVGLRRWQGSWLEEIGNDVWVTEFSPDTLGPHEFEIEAWSDSFATWKRDARIKLEDGQKIDLELMEGAGLIGEALQIQRGRKRTELERCIENLRNESLGYADRLTPALDPGIGELISSRPTADVTRSERVGLWVDRERALFSSWYEMFPRSEGGFEGAMKRLRAIADMGFDVVYLPPIHPIGKTNRKGKNNSLTRGPGDPGSPWAIGGEEGGHTAIHPDLGTFADFDRFLSEAESLGLEVALDYALQCSPDHPWVREHPEWFQKRPDGSVRYAENPPKKYEDIYQMNFWPEQGREELWEACRGILEFWIGRGVRIFRVDNPHTKPVRFWEWMITQIRQSHPEVILLAEAFTRPKMMSKLAEVGYQQSYTYFTWRTTKQELTEYATEVALTPKADYMRPNFWPNTPDIISGPLRHGGPGAFKQRLVLAATMSPSYGIYGGYELMENEPFSEDSEEYLNSEKYEIPKRNWDDPSSLAPYITRVNAIRQRHPSLNWLRNIRFQGSSSDHVIAYSKQAEDPAGSTGDADVLLIVVNLSTTEPQETTLTLDLPALGLPSGDPYEAHEELTNTTYLWRGSNPYVWLDHEEPAQIFQLRRRAAVKKP